MPHPHHTYTLVPRPRASFYPAPLLFFDPFPLPRSLYSPPTVIAVLLDEFLTTMSKARAEIDREVCRPKKASIMLKRDRIILKTRRADICITRQEYEEANPSANVGHCLDPLMEVLAKYRSAAGEKLSEHQQEVRENAH